MIRQLILSKQNYLQLSVVLLGSLFGLLLMMSSTQIYMDIQSIFDTRKDLVSSQFLVVNKTVSIVNAISGEGAVFSEEEIDAFRSLKSVEKIGVFEANRFRAQTGFQLQDKTMMTDMFFESVPDEFLDVKSSEWNWREGQPVPIILPTDYLNLYNFGFAPSQGLPQISKNMAKMAGLKIVISGNGKELELPGVIAGFTDRINSILVPQKFLNFANANYGNTNAKGISRLVVLSKDPSNPELIEYINENGYETNLELLKSGKLSSLLKSILSVVLIVCLVIIALSILGFLQYAQLLINNSKYEIKTLLQIGYPIRILFSAYMKFYVLLMIVVLALSLLSLYGIKIYFNQFMTGKGFELSGMISTEVMLSGLGLVVFFVLFNAISTYSLIRNFAKSGN